MPARSPPIPHLQKEGRHDNPQKGNLGKAIDEYERLTTFDPKNPELKLVHPLYYYRLAKLYGQKGNRSKAAARYHRFLDL